MLSLSASLFLHGLLAFLLWCLVYQVVKQPSITLSASSSYAPETVTLEVNDLPEPVIPIVEQGEAASTEPQPEPAAEDTVRSLVDEEGLAEMEQSNLRPSSVEFFGTRAYGDKFVFLLDVSYSMDARNGARYRRACDELVRAASELRPSQSYYVFLFCWNTQLMYYQDSVAYIEAQPGHVKKLRRWVYDASLGPGTDPRRALSFAREMEPDAIFLLSDGQFNQPRTPMSETGWLDLDGNRSQVSVLEGVPIKFTALPIHTIAFENPFTRGPMEQIAKLTGGVFRYVKTDSFQPVDAERFLNALRRIEEKHRRDKERRSEFITRLSYARDFIADGELVYAEYIARPVRSADKSQVANRTLYDEIFGVLDRELGDTRLEDFESPPDLSKW